MDLLVALCGGDISLIGIDDAPIRLEETEVIHPGSVRRVPGLGMPIPGEEPGTRGDLYLDYEVIFPADMDMARREMVATALQRPSQGPAVLPTTLLALGDCYFSEDPACGGRALPTPTPQPQKVVSIDTENDIEDERLSQSFTPE